MKDGDSLMERLSQAKIEREQARQYLMRVLAAQGIVHYYVPLVILTPWPPVEMLN